MADSKQVTITAEAAQLLAAPIEGAREHQNRVHDLEYRLVKTRGALLLIARAVECMAESHVTHDEMQLTDDEVTQLFATVDLLEQVAADCADAYGGKR